MKDFEKMKADFDKKLEMAKTENELEEKVAGEGILLHVFEGIEGFVCLAYTGSLGISKRLTPRQLGCLLKTFPPTDKVKVSTARHNDDVDVDYYVEIHNGYKYTDFNIHWICNGIQFRITTEYYMVESLFAEMTTSTYRGIDSSEASTYLGGATQRKINSVKIACRCWFTGDVVNFYNGEYSVLKSDWAIKQVVEKLLYKYEFADTETGE